MKLRAVAQAARTAIDDDGPVVAALVALRGLLIRLDQPEMPAVQENITVLGQALGAQREFLILRSHEYRVSTAAFSPDGIRVVTASWDGTARLWDAATGAELLVLRGHEDAVSTAAFSPDGIRVVTASSDRTARLWDAATGAELLVLRGHEDAVSAAAFSPDGSRVVTASWNGAVRLWDAATGAELLVLRNVYRPELGFNFAAFSIPFIAAALHTA